MALERYLKGLLWNVLPRGTSAVLNFKSRTLGPPRPFIEGIRQLVGGGVALSPFLLQGSSPPAPVSNAATNHGGAGKINKHFQLLGKFWAGFKWPAPLG